MATVTLEHEQVRAAFVKAARVPGPTFERREDIALALADAFLIEGAQELTLPDFERIALELDLEFTEVYLAAMVLTAKGILERVFLSCETDPPTRVPPEEVCRHLRECSGPAFRAWTRQVKVIWRMLEVKS